MKALCGSSDPAVGMISQIWWIFPITWKTLAQFWSSEYRGGSTLGADMGANGQRLEMELLPRSLAVICGPLNSS
jgi:hypothetical protein